MSSYRTLGSESRLEIPKIKGSRFIATCVPVADATGASVALERIRRELYDARHHCSAYRLGRSTDVFRADDDGEPSGSAGRPILREIDARDLVDTLVIVTRYFGGTKLGVGGLVRAYGSAAGAALDAADVRTIVITQRVTVRHAYELSSAIAAALATTGHQPVAVEYLEVVTLAFDIPVGDVERFRTEVVNRTAGQVEIDVA